MVGEQINNAVYPMYLGYVRYTEIYYISLEEYMMLYWVSAIIQNKESAKPTLLALNDGYPTLEAARDVVAHIKKDNTVLSVWIDAFDKENNKETVFHECYIDAFGTVWPTKECGSNG